MISRVAGFLLLGFVCCILCISGLVLATLLLYKCCSVCPDCPCCVGTQTCINKNVSTIDCSVCGRPRPLSCVNGDMPSCERFIPCLPCVNNTSDSGNTSSVNPTSDTSLNCSGHSSDDTERSQTCPIGKFIYTIMFSHYCISRKLLSLPESIKLPATSSMANTCNLKVRETEIGI